MLLAFTLSFGMHLQFVHLLKTKHFPKYYTCNKASSPNNEQDNVGVVPRKPLSVTSSTVSPMDNTRVAFTNETTMYESNSSKGPTEIV